ncbi:Helix-turn-helix domain-containing protein [Brevibacterium sp. 239c]|uniref:helix-turn-helix domain-containing protein n=1 Tax=Brevibacterium sp. 239c TaxID=1965356 RepID=UPI000C3790EA|nr:helix-turn-helix domain-containing protein [Brevibacterium sp. 239c]SMX94093.1 Helix-turn-helix domain-containing protein [Brevibacterium sp. 239c]
MYTEMRIPRLRASLWTSAPDARPTSALAEVAVSVPSKPSLIVPDGCMDLIVIDSLVVVAGADSTARTFHSASTSGAAQPVVGLRFDPGVLPQLLATSAAELADRVPPLDAVVTAGSLATVPEPGPGVGQRRLLDIAETLTARADIDSTPLELAGLLGVREESPAPDIAEVAAQFAYSPRQLRRLSSARFGYGPKHLSKVLRWQAARALIDAGSTRTAAATATGYADAAHLWRDEKSLLGR